METGLQMIISSIGAPARIETGDLLVIHDHTVLTCISLHRCWALLSSYYDYQLKWTV